ncbi:MAG TPA: M56 family metallopeptidase, partial [Gammaproteobacteria bacterium]|nr:M56 family metallopeptidase [Gammaproteobacteria bacterium]
MEITASENLLLAFLTSSPWLSTILDWLIKSALIICITYLIVQLLSNKLSSGSKHLLWLNSLACAMLVPLFISLSVLLEAPTPFATQLLSIQVVPSTTYVASTSVDSIPWMSGAVVLLYLLPVMALLLKLTTSIANVFRINRTAEPALDLADLNRLVQLQGQQRIARPVALKYSGQVISPLSFGLFKPTIILPEQARCWDRNITDDVLFHELSHIKRLDWLTMFVSYVIASVLWISPLSWLALRKLNEEAENSCDGTVLRLKEEETSYAETLLSIAHDMKGDSAPE